MCMSSSSSVGGWLWVCQETNCHCRSTADINLETYALRESHLLRFSVDVSLTLVGPLLNLTLGCYGHLVTQYMRIEAGETEE